nr:zinc finger, CCHC-type, retrotransposon Gag domain protein [Tanacetum cinerariifolium]
MEKLFQVLGCPDNFKTHLAAFKLGGDALSLWKAHLRTQVGGDAFADTCTWVAFREIFYNRYFPASKQQRYEHEYGSICHLDRENSGEYIEKFTRLASFVGVADAARNIELLHESGIRISRIEMIIGFRTGDRVNKRSGVVMTRVSMYIGVIRTRVLSIGVVRIEVMIRNDRIFGVRIRGLLVGIGMTARVKARTLISHGCQAFLASVMDTSFESPNIEILSVVREFADVFPDELPRLPSAREIE